MHYLLTVEAMAIFQPSKGVSILVKHGSLESSVFRHGYVSQRNTTYPKSVFYTEKLSHSFRILWAQKHLLVMTVYLESDKKTGAI